MYNLIHHENKQPKFETQGLHPKNNNAWKFQPALAWSIIAEGSKREDSSASKKTLQHGQHAS